METLSSLLSLQNIAAIIIIYFGSLAFYRLFLHPLAQFPGPKLAAITRYYEAYYDIVQNGQYTFKIVEMHKKYGTVPSLHDLSFIDTSCGSNLSFPKVPSFASVLTSSMLLIPLSSKSFIARTDVGTSTLGH
jgi:hypothetical protein